MRVAVRHVCLLLVTLALGACASTPAAPPATAIPITDFKMVSGRWLGAITGLPGRRDEGDTANLTIGDDGSYDFGVYRTIGVFGGKGQFKLEDGKMTIQGERGNATLSLYEQGGRRILKGDGQLRSGIPVSAEFKPAP